MNKLMQLGFGLVLLICMGGVKATSLHPNQMLVSPSFDSLMLPGSKLVAGGEDEFFILAPSEPAPIKRFASKGPKLMVFEVKSIAPSSDPAEKKINRLFALHQAIGAASDKPQRLMAAVKVVKSIKQIHVAAIKPAHSLHNMKLKA